MASRAVVVGLGGIGSNLVDPLSRMLMFSKSNRKADRVVLVDGDQYEPKNMERQRGKVHINKAEATKDLLGESFPDLEVDAKARYVDPNNIYLFVKEGDTVFLCVDNHATRKVLADHMQTLKNGLLISGGNEEYDGNVQIHERRDGRDLTPPITHLHPEIEKPTDRNPATLNCGELIVTQGATQVLAVNLAVASLMINAYTLYLETGELPYTEVYTDIKTGSARAVKRVVIK